MHRVVGQLSVIFQRLVNLLLQPFLDIRILGQQMCHYTGLRCDRVETTEEEAERVIRHILYSRLFPWLSFFVIVHEQLQNIRPATGPLPGLYCLCHLVVEKFGNMTIHDLE